MYLQLFCLLFWFSGFSAEKKRITGPGTARGQERGSLTVQCQYSSQWKSYRKWWCRGADWSTCKMLIETDGSERLVKEERLSIRDYQKDLMFNVTLGDLRRDDADSYWCGIEKFGIDLGDKVKVTIVPVPVTVEETISVLTSTNDHFSDGYSVTNLSILLPLVCAVLFLLLVAATLLAWRMMKQQKKDRALAAQIGDVSTGALSSEQPKEDDLCYANLSLHQSGTSPGSFWPKAFNKSSSAQANEEEVEYVTMAPVKREEISYASLCLDALNQEPTYSNTGHTRSRGREGATEYTSIRKP
ncbi:CMRF35-like molecule 1 isoform X2 [Cavia porcellus]|uniref:CMRF35-like molecule 1 isoform X2 n=1 Tax=Cavia porcellus TaxID=10141 RepID=UPI000661AF2A|nr:CMRF35-like molecule 1 isoform X2 [Cavia porcellus]